MPAPSSPPATPRALRRSSSTATPRRSPAPPTTRSGSRQGPGASFVALPGADRFPWLGDADAVIHAVHAFLGNARSPSFARGQLATVLALDAADELAPSVADRVNGYSGIVRRCAQRYQALAASIQRRRMLAAFDGPVRALRCAMAI